MIVEFVQFTYPPGLSREQILDDARTTIPRWRGNTELIRKHYLVGEDGSGGAFYIWPSKEAAQRGHNADWFANIKARTGAVPTSNAAKVNSLPRIHFATALSSVPLSGGDKDSPASLDCTRAPHNFLARL